MAFALALVVLCGLVALAVAAPLRAPAARATSAVLRRAELEAAREATYRDLRDARLDFAMGKVTASDHRRTDRELRAQAIAILRQLDALD
jgi:hypothetical protein